MDLRQGFELLHTDPRTLMDSCFVSLAGGAKNDISGVSWFALSMPAARQGMYKREGGSTTIPAFEVSKLSQAPAKMKYRSGENNEEHLAFEGWYVAMKRQAVQGSVPIGTLCRLSLTDGPNLCITSQLSACTVGIGSQNPGGCCAMSHIEPARNTPLATAQLEMADQTNYLLNNNVQVLVSKGVTYTDRAHVLGHRVGGYWRFYLQAFSAGHNRLIRAVQNLT